jgi:glutamine synthetase
VLTPRELKARVDVLYERYNTVVGIEARTLTGMLKTAVLPAALRAQTELAETVSATRSAGVECPDTEAALQDHILLVSELRDAIRDLEKVEAKHPAGAEAHARHVRDGLIPAMARARSVSDRLEASMPEDLWPYPTYAEMLFVR